MIGAQTVLLIAPLGTMKGWRATFARQGVDLPFRQIKGDDKGKVAYEDYQWGVPGIYFIGPELMVTWGWDDVPLFIGRGKNKKPRLDPKSGKQLTRATMNEVWSGIEPDMIIFDEVHRAQNRDSKTAKTLHTIDGGYKMACSGTWTGNTFEGAWAVTHWLWPWLNPKFADWKKTYCETKFDPFEFDRAKIIGEKNPGEFVKTLPCYIRLESEFEMPKPLIRTVQLSKPQRLAFNQLKKNMVAWIKDSATGEDKPLVVEFPFTLRARLRQATLAMFDVDEEGEVTFPNDAESSKLDELYKIIDEETNGEPVLISTGDSQKFATLVTHRLNERYGEGSAMEWSGIASQSKREKKIKPTFLAGNLRFLVTLPSAIGEGTDGLQHVCRYGIMASRSDQRLLNEQWFGRLVRGGQTREVTYWEIIAEDTYDTGILDKQIGDAIASNKSLQAARKKAAREAKRRAKMDGA